MLKLSLWILVGQAPYYFLQIWLNPKLDPKKGKEETLYVSAIYVHLLSIFLKADIYRPDFPLCQALCDTLHVLSHDVMLALWQSSFCKGH